MTTYLITGATGTLGHLATQALRTLEPTAHIAVLARPGADVDRLRESGAAVRRGDYDDPPSLRAACAGIERALLVSSPVLDPTVRARQHLAFLDAAAAAGVAHLTYTSALGAEHDPGHHRTEQALAQGSTSHTILRNGLYTEPFVERAWQEALTTGVVRSATQGHALRTVSVNDLALAAAQTLAAPLPGATLELNGPEWTYDGLADAITTRLGRPVHHESVDDAELGPFGPVHALFRAGLLAQSPADLTRLIGRAPRTAGEVLAVVVG
ncbi:NAD(P)H-binding protein [Pimelobacter simplex]|uniref:NAD(P)H-binding protein n=1 Tax=Nocardioides simplex TaxID=2045 RepID=UPI003AADC9EE